MNSKQKRIAHQKKVERRNSEKQAKIKARQEATALRKRYTASDSGTPMGSVATLVLRTGERVSGLG